MLMRRVDWEMFEYYQSLDAYKKAHKICENSNCEQTNFLQTTSWTNTDELSPNTGFPEWWLSPVRKPLNQGYVMERRAGRYLERRVVSHQQSGGYIAKLPHEQLPFSFDENGDPEVLKPYVLRDDLKIVENPIPDSEDKFFKSIFHVGYDPLDVRFMKSAESRAMDIKSVRRTCDNFKWLVRANERQIRLFVTLTYAENMTDTKRLYEDFRNFWQKLKRAHKDIKGYLVAFEPQKRGAWHAHMLLISENPFLRIPNKEVNALWGFGFTKTQGVHNIKDIGTYLTSYLVNVKSGNRTKKGARLYMYPAGFHFARHSRNGIKYTDSSRWFGTYNRLDDVTKWDLLYDYENVRKVGNTGFYIKSKILCLSRKEEFS